MTFKKKKDRMLKDLLYVIESKGKLTLGKEEHTLLPLNQIETLKA